MRIVCGEGSIKRSGVRPSVCPSVSLSHQLNAAAACGGFAAERRTRQRYRSIAPGARQQHAAARGRSTALSSKCGQCHVDSRINEPEHRLGLFSILGLFKFWQCSLLVRNLCPVATCTELYIDTLGGLDLDGSTRQKSPVFRRGKSGNPRLASRRKFSPLPW